MTDSQTDAPINEDTVSRIIRDLVTKREWFAFAAQGTAILASLIVDNLPPNGELVLFVLLITHSGLACWCFYKRKGPFGLGWVSATIWVCSAFLSPLLMVQLIPQGEYGSTPSCVQMCGYPVAPVLVMAAYPWGRSPGTRLATELGVLLLIGISPLLVILSANGRFTPENLWAVLMSFLYVAIYYVAGRTVHSMCKQAANNQADQTKRELKILDNLFHSDSIILLSRLKERAENGEFEKIPRLIEEAEKNMRKAEIDTYLRMPNVNVLRLLRKYINTSPIRDQIILRAPSGSFTLENRAGEVVYRTVSALVTNAQQHGSLPVFLTPNCVRNVFYLEVRDSGNGINSNELNNERNSLPSMRKELRRLGGDLTIKSTPGEGARLLLYVPVEHGPESEA
ncbi:ATP-binding protein [Nocardiopsis sp. CNT312]|uniref:ATP-binding protein n=1 Tax=Nocardiopsis sp. CNT312 TaxID=1137268 RepID=UPI0012DF5F63|nr:ATP-binding protein [Nocardiopsis sp. CNT312]